LIFVLVSATLGGTATATPPFPPTQICRGDDGAWRVNNDYLGGSYFQVFYEDDERARYILDLEKAIPKDEWDGYVGMTTAGPEWADHSLHYFIDLDGKPHFCVRTWWDRRILIDLAQLKQASDTRFAKTLEQKERKLVLETLKQAAGRYGRQKLARWGRDIFAIPGAARVAGRLRMREAVEYLNLLESVPFVDSIGGATSDDGLEEGDINPFSCGKYKLRRIVQVSLRLLGEKPQGYPATFWYHLVRKTVDDNDYLTSGAKYQPRQYRMSRHERAPQLAEGMKPVEVLDVMGPPDVVERWVHAWRWDVDTESPYSLVVEWDRRLYKVLAVRRVQPPLWQSDGVDFDPRLRSRKSPETLAPPRKRPEIDRETKQALAELKKLGAHVDPGVPDVYGPAVSFRLAAGVPDEAWPLLRRVTELRDLNLEQAGVDDDDLAEIGKLTTLEYLFLDGTGVTDEGLQHLAGLKRLQILRLCQTAITDEGLAHVKALPKLRRLHLMNTNVTDAGMEHLKECKKLSILELSATKITDQAMATLSGEITLSHLMIDNTAITDEGLRHISKIVVFQLYAKNTKITDAGLPHLYDLHLDSANISGPGVTKEGYAELEKHLDPH